MRNAFSILISDFPSSQSIFFQFENSIGHVHTLDMQPVYVLNFHNYHHAHTHTCGFTFLSFLSVSLVSLTFLDFFSLFILILCAKHDDNALFHNIVNAFISMRFISSHRSCMQHTEYLTVKHSHIRIAASSLRFSFVQETVCEMHNWLLLFIFAKQQVKLICKCG